MRARLDSLPYLLCVRFQKASIGVTPELMDVVLSKVTRIEIAWTAKWMPNSPIQSTRICTVPNPLTHLSYEPNEWHEFYGGFSQEYLEAHYLLERNYLTQLVCGMHMTAQSLSLPMEAAPLAEMSGLSWPNIRDFSLRGRYPASSSDRLLPELLVRILPQLQSLCVRAAPRNTFPRPPVLGPSMASEPITLPDLQSLTVAYPDPTDTIFTIHAPRLNHLSLSDQPRHYFARRTPEYVAEWCAAPILSASECLGILQRMETPLLESIELVYQADSAEDDLLRHLATYPLLEIVELHRYREHDSDLVPSIHVVTALSAVRCLRRLYLNLDFQEMPPVHDERVRDYTWNTRAWVDFRNAQAQEFLRILQVCPRFEYLALLSPKDVCAIWVEYRPPWSQNYDMLFDSIAAMILRSYVIHMNPHMVFRLMRTVWLRDRQRLPHTERR
ncbi:hypothetical protein C8Q73DRAFT_635673 [Cubamyces lactineus]|nr:hypothetical protein C8Q73DRAFT_635673 [Cubamyces lactineus]